MTKIAVCFVTTYYPPYNFGGDGVAVRRMANGLAALGHRVRVVHGAAAHRMLSGEPPAPRDREDHPAIEVFSCPPRQGQVVATYLTGMPLGYRRNLEELVTGFDVVHFLNPSLLGGPGSFELGEGLKVYTTGEHWLLCPTNFLFRYNREICTNRTCWRCSLTYRRPPQPWRSTGLLKRSLKHIDVLICPSRFTARLHKEMYPWFEPEVIPLPGLDPHEIESLPPAAAGGSPYFLYSGRIERLKGVDRLIDAVSTVPGARLLVAGEGSQLESLKRVAHSDQVQFLGRLPEADLLATAARALAVVVPSVGYETFGLAGAEAMAVGAPVIVRELGPLPELVEEGGGVTFKDEAELALTLKKFLDGPGWAADMGRRAAEVAARRFAQSVVVRQYLDCISRAAARSGRESLAARADMSKREIAP